jgi:serine/threonine protein kinase
MAPAAPEDEEYVSPATLPGAVIDEKYRVERVIGRGGVGLVVAATHLGMGQLVAIKMIRDDIPMQRELLDRFHREARAAAMIRSEHVARVLDVGRLPTGRPYIVMEFLEGEDLERVVSRGPLNVTSAVDFALQACEALAEAHRAGVIHRDLKPANLFLSRRADGEPLVKLLDFGISKISPLTAVRSSRGVETTSIMGSPGYMAPEQMKSTRDVDARADVWSLGTVLYEMLVGRPAFEGASMLEILNAIAASELVPPSHRQRGIPRELDVVIARCLEREPDQRYGGIAELAMALRPFASPGGAALADRALRISQEPAPVMEEPQFSALLSEPRPSALTVITPGRRRTPQLIALLGGLVGVLLAGAIVGVYMLRTSGGPIGSSLSVAAPVAPGPASPAASPVAAAAAPPATVAEPAPPSTWTASSSSAVPPASAIATATRHRPVYYRPPSHHPHGPAEAPGTSPFGDRK